jgi:hypothetical protein
MTEYAETREPGNTCEDCGVLVNDWAVHARFHSILSSHAWALAVLKTAHVGPGIHANFDVAERMDRRKFDNWSADALAEVMLEMDRTDPQHNDGRSEPMTEDKMRAAMRQVEDNYTTKPFDGEKMEP